jgi:hypothetical protein
MDSEVFQPGGRVDRVMRGGLMSRGDEDYFAGELFLTLATEGRLVVDSDRADELIADLEHTLAILQDRLRVLEIWHRHPAPAVEKLPPELTEAAVDAVFADQLAPGRLAQAAVELPKYVAALRAARRRARSRDDA